MATHNVLSGRPSAEEWQQHFDRILSGNGLARCPSHPNNYKHIRFSGMPCPQCQLDASNATRRVPLRAPSRTPAGNTTPAGMGAPQPAKPSKLDFFSVLDFAVKVLVGLVLLFLLISALDQTFGTKSSTRSNVATPAVSSQARTPPSNQGSTQAPSAYQQLLSPASPSAQRASPSQPTRSQAAPSSSANPWTVPTVAQIQGALRTLGFNPGPIDGVMGPRTQRAIRDFQRSRGLVADGRITQQLDLALRAALAAR